MMSSSDAIIWNIEADPQLRSTVMAVWMLESVPAPGRMAANIDRMVAAIPRLRQVAEDGRPRPSWVEVDRIDIDEHYTVDELPPGSDLRDVLTYAEHWVRTPFDRNRPLWRLGLLSGLPEGRAAVVIKVHHAIADGMGMVLMLGAFTDVEADPPRATPADNVVEFPQTRQVFSAGKRLWFKTRRAAGTFLRHPLGSSLDTISTLGSAVRLVIPNRTPLSRHMTGRSGHLHMDTRALPVDAIKRTGRQHGTSVNDVFVAIVADAVDGYHRRRGADLDRLRVHMPVDIRNERTAALAGNQFVPARISLRLTEPHPNDRLTEVRAQLDQLRREPALHHINTVSAAIQRLGRPISRWIIGGMMKGVDVLASNVPGPPFPLYLAGSRIEEFYAFGPPAGAALNITLFSYDGHVHLGITTDAAAVVDRGLFLECIDQSIATFTSAAIADVAHCAS